MYGEFQMIYSTPAETQACQRRALLRLSLGAMGAVAFPVDRGRPRRSVGPGTVLPRSCDADARRRVLRRQRRRLPRRQIAHHAAEVAARVARARDEAMYAHVARVASARATREEGSEHRGASRDCLSHPALDDAAPRMIDVRNRKATVYRGTICRFRLPRSARTRCSRGSTPVSPTLRCRHARPRRGCGPRSSTT